METNQNPNSLLRKTRQQLVDIILRKDDVHKTLNEKLNEVNERYNTKMQEFETFSKNHDCLVKDYNNLDATNKELEEKLIQRNQTIAANSAYIEKLHNQLSDKEVVLDTIKERLSETEGKVEDFKEIIDEAEVNAGKLKNTISIYKYVCIALTLVLLGIAIF